MKVAVLQCSCSVGTAVNDVEEVGVEVKSDGAAVAAAGVGMEFVPSEKKAEEEEKKEATEEEKVEKTAGDDDMDDLC
jgi:ribosomal protein L12E/L44/L45/RPP1/RPP2